MIRKIALATAVLLTGPTVAPAATLTDGEAVVFERFEGTVLYFGFEKLPDSARKIHLVVTGPNGYLAEVETGKRIPRIDLRDFLGYRGDPTDDKRQTDGPKELADGVYSYEIRFSTSEKVPEREKVDNGREKSLDFTYKVYAMAGSFLLEGGKIAVFTQRAERPVAQPEGDDKPSEDVDEGHKPPEDPPGEDVNDSDKI